MYVDLNVPVPQIPTQQIAQTSKKGKGKQTQQPSASAANVAFTPGQLNEVESRVDLLVHLGYTVIAFNQTVQKKVDPKTHVNLLDPLLLQLRKRAGVVYVKRLTIVLDEDSEKGFGLTTGNSSLFAPYDLIALLPTTAASFSLACLTHTLPSPLTAHIISLPLTLPRLPFNLKHTFVRSALKNGAVFEISYAGALGCEPDPSLGSAASGEGGSSGKRNWWAAAREVARVTKGKGIVVASGAVNQTSLRAPKDVGNLVTMLDLPQNLSHDATTKTPQAIILRAQTRRTYRAILSEPRIVIPEGFATSLPSGSQGQSAPTGSVPVEQPAHAEPSSTEIAGDGHELPAPAPAPQPPSKSTNGKKRALEEDTGSTLRPTGSQSKNPGQAEGASKKKRKKNQPKETVG